MLRHRTKLYLCATRIWFALNTVAGIDLRQGGGTDEPSAHAPAAGLSFDAIGDTWEPCVVFWVAQRGRGVIDRSIARLNIEHCRKMLAAEIERDKAAEAASSAREEEVKPLGAG